MPGSSQTGGQACSTVNQCFKEGTLVETEEGLKPIEEIEVGDKVLAYDEATGEQAYKPVVQLFRNTSHEWIIVKVNGVEIESTPGHKYYLPKSNSWVSAKDLQVGTKVLLSDGGFGEIERVIYKYYNTAQTTYNFEVADFHTYYVSENGVLVHNKGCGGNSHKEIADEMGYKKVKGRYSHGSAIYSNSKASKELRYITPDVDMHNGGFWKAASSIKNLQSRQTRTGTFDMYLKRRIGP